MLDFMDRLRPLVGSKGWDYCVRWRINEDQRFLECIACFCAGAETGNFNELNDLMFPASSQFSCKDAVFPHQRTKSCELLSQFPSYMPLDSGIYAEALFSRQPRWLNIFTDPDPNKAATEDMPATRVLIPLLGGLVELFVAKQVPEDENVVGFITSQCAMPLALDALVNSSLGISSNTDVEQAHLGIEKDLASASNSHFHQPGDGINQQANEIRSLMTPLQNSNSGSDHTAAVKNGSDMPSQNVDLFSNKDLNDKDSVRPEAGRSESISDCNNQMDDENVSKRSKTTGKGQSKNLDAERKRRKKLNENLYKLRTLVPIISKLDKAHILVDAIEYVKQQQKQVQELQEKLEQDLINDGTEDIVDEFESQVHENVPSPFVARACGTDTNHEMVQQMEPQVDVTPVDRSNFVIRVFCEHKPGGLVRLLEALCSLGLEVVNVNVTSCRMLVSYVFHVEMKGDTTQVVADDLKNSLLELTQIPSGAPWQPSDETSNKSENRIGIGYRYDQLHLLGHHTNLYHLQ